MQEFAHIEEGGTAETKEILIVGVPQIKVAVLELGGFMGLDTSIKDKGQLVTMNLS